MEVALMDSQILKDRTQQFALDIIALVDSLPKRRVADVIGNQLVRSGTSVGANYRAACRAKSPADFISKMGTVEEEADETIYWMDLLVKSTLVSRDRVAGLVNEANQLVAIVVASINTARRNKTRR
jgi:four helix bundle protein